MLQEESEMQHTVDESCEPEAPPETLSNMLVTLGRQKVLPVAIALTLMYMTVLGFDGVSSASDNTAKLRK